MAESFDPEAERAPSSQTVHDVKTLGTPVAHRFDPPLEHRPYEEILEEVNAAMAAMMKRRYGRKKVT